MVTPSRLSALLLSSIFISMHFKSWESKAMCIVVFQSGTVSAARGNCVDYFERNPCHFKRLGLERAAIHGSLNMIERSDEDCPLEYVCLKRKTQRLGIYGTMAVISDNIRQQCSE